MQMIYETPMKIELSGTKLSVDDKEITPSVRMLSQLKEVMMNDVNIGKTGDLEMYYMYRDILRKEEMRYDITFIPYREVAGECAKTYGHCHPIAEEKLTYPEIYQVLSGRAFFILQKELGSAANIVTMVDAKKGDVILIPPNHCHVSINPGPEDLLLSNIVADNFKSVYSYFKENRGAAYYYADNGELIQNSNYIVEKNERITAADLNRKYEFECRDLLTEFYSNPDKFEFLKKPSLL